MIDFWENTTSTPLDNIGFPSRFPAVYYGFALLYQKLNRYDESKKYTKQGLAYLEKGQILNSWN